MLVGKPLLVIAIMSLMRYPLRVSVPAGLPLGQISEFSWILAALGLSLGHINNATVSLITVDGLVTIAASTYMITYSQPISERAKRWLAVLERRNPRERESHVAEDYDVILYGLGRFGGHLADRLSGAGHHVLAVDFDFHQVKMYAGEGVTAMFGSADALVAEFYPDLMRTVRDGFVGGDDVVVDAKEVVAVFQPAVVRIEAPASAMPPG